MKTQDEPRTYPSCVRLAASLGLVAALLLASCRSATDSPPKEEANSSGDAAQAEPTKISTRIMTWSDIEQFLKSHPGKIVVADVWSTSCIPCMRELPHLFELQQKHPDSIVAVSINIDFAGLPDDPPQNAQKKAESFLQQHAAAADSIHLVSSTEDAKVYELAEIPSVPAVLVFNNQGKLVKKFGIEGEEFSYAKTITPFVESLLQ